MAIVGPIQIYTNLTNLKSISDITRFLTAFTSQVGSQFNNLLSNRMISGAIGATGSILAGLNFGTSFVTTGSYYVKFNPPYSQRPSIIVTPESSATIYTAGVTTTGFMIAASANTAFSFIARGEN